MNKKLVAVAIAGLVAAPLAQAQTANVTLYGRLNMDVEVVNGKILNTDLGVVQPAACTGTAVNVNNCITKNPSQYRVSSNSSNFGFRGSESLGGGLTAIFQVESQTNLDTGIGSLNARNTFVGLQGSFGTVKLGRYHLPYDDIHDSAVGFGNNTYETGTLATSAIWAQGFTSKANGGFDDRLSNSVRWDSPVWSGLKLAASYSAGGNSGTICPSASAGCVEGQPKPNSGVYSAGLFYGNGPLNIGAVYQYNVQFRAAGLNDYAWTVAANYQFPKFKIMGIYEKINYDCGPVSCSSVAHPGTATLSLTHLSRNMWGLGGLIDVGAGQIFADWTQGQQGKGSAPFGQYVGAITNGSDSGANQYEIAYIYPLSKRTILQFGYNMIANESRAAYNFGTNSYGIITGGKPQSLMAGVIHLF